MGQYHFGGFVDVFLTISGGMGDEAAVSSACEEMMTMVGNEGQATLIGDQLEKFSDWGMEVLEGITDIGTDWDDFQAMVTYEWYGGDLDKWDGTDIIWHHGWKRVSEQSGYHDSVDDFGEGVGVVFGYGRWA